MKKYIVITKTKVCIEIVSEGTLEFYASAKEYINERYDKNEVMFFRELPENEPAVVTIYKDGVYKTPDILEQLEDYAVIYGNDITQIED